MHATVGDRLIVKSSSGSRRGLILSVSHDGEPPFTVRWLDTGRKALVFPAPDAEVIDAGRQAALDREQAERTERLQAEIRNQPRRRSPWASTPNDPS